MNEVEASAKKAAEASKRLEERANLVVPTEDPITRFRRAFNDGKPIDSSQRNNGSRATRIRKPSES